MNAAEERWLRRTLALAAHGTRATAPNPRVGAVVTQAEQVVGEGWHQKAGAAHAEIVALERAGAAARGATLYVSLEPCSFQGRTPPCVAAIGAAGIARVVVATLDPDPRVDGRGVEQLRAAGIEVVVADGALRADALQFIEEYRVHRCAARSFVHVKIAATLDGRIADRWGQAQWITGEAARQRGRELRDRCGAVIVGARTVSADDPTLFPLTPIAAGGTFLRCVVDGALSISPRCRLVASAREVPVVVFTDVDAPAVRRQALERAGVEVVAIPAREQQLDPLAIAKELAARGVLAVYVEGGGRTVANFFEARVVDKVHWFVASKLLVDAQAIPGLAGGPRPLEAALALEIAQLERVGEDTLLTLYPKGTGPGCSPA